MLQRAKQGQKEASYYTTVKFTFCTDIQYLSFLSQKKN